MATPYGSDGRMAPLAQRIRDEGPGKKSDCEQSARDRRCEEIAAHRRCADPERTGREQLDVTAAEEPEAKSHRPRDEDGQRDRDVKERRSRRRRRRQVRIAGAPGQAGSSRARRRWTIRRWAISSAAAPRRARSQRSVSDMPWYSPASRTRPPWPRRTTVPAKGFFSVTRAHPQRPILLPCRTAKRIW